MTKQTHDENTGGTAEFANQLAARLAEYGDCPCIEFEQRWYTGEEIVDHIRAIELALADVSTSERVAIIVRNRVPHAAAVLGCIAESRPIAMINSYQSAESMARDIEQLRPSAVIADHQDWTALVLAACERVGSAGVSLSLDPPRIETVLLRTRSADPVAEVPGLHILTSGTTGPPKRVPIPLSALEHTVRTMTGGETAARDDPPELVYWPFGSVGICQLLAGPFLGKRMVLLEKFSVEEWVRAVKTYRIRRAGVQPTILRLILQADVPREDLASLEYLPGGSGPLEPELRAEFEQRYGIPLLWAYGATEFAGSVCAWTPELHQRFGATKQGSVGRPLPGVRVRVIDTVTGSEAAVGAQGFLEAEVAVLGPDWVRTTDLASVDADGFVTVHGRGDGAINRGGFKILPETVRKVLLGHPAVRDACVVGVPDARLGQVPFAAVEVRRGAPVPIESDLKELVRQALPSHHVPVAIEVVEQLPRNAALKAKLDEVAAMYGRE
ncbi:class I adenylate-forming enzyme family protein [Nocardia pseudovaccinii]|uniref:class I adenylate-forming enzyme family protein n=1 Tax=Nocardia pseudovaccinii TaxID=189540 RepID=UPI0007A3B72A|nr:long-chain fatty acid--CoA ligase [Nocardia pseudovaccinii]